MARVSIMPEEPQRPKNWAPIAGRWDTARGRLLYQSPQVASPHPFGLLASDINLAEGEVTAQVMLNDQENCGRIVLGYRSTDARYVSLGVGGYNGAYVLSEFVPAFGWRALSVSGSKANLDASGYLRLRARLLGQKVYLQVNDVAVIEHVLDRPLPPGQVGLTAWGKGPVSFKDVNVTARPGKVFVVMQFSDNYQQLYTEVIQPVVKEFKLHAYHAGEVFGPGLILQDIVNSLVEAKIVIAEITPTNSNVFYEIGYAHALAKPTILLAERGKDLPFDVSGYRCLFYENTIAGKQNVENALRRHLEAILHE